MRIHNAPSFAGPKWLILCLALLAPFASAEEKIEHDANGERIWDFTGYIKGTRFKIRDQLNTEIVRLDGKIKESVKSLETEKKDLAADTQVAMIRLHKSADYLKVKSDMETAKAALDAAHEARDTSTALDASSRYNKARAALASMERTAVYGYEPANLDQQRVTSLQHDLNRLKEAMAKAQKWRNELLEATHNTYMLHWPLDSGASGVLGTIKPLQIMDRDSMLLVYDAVELISMKDKGEGLATMQTISHPVAIMLKGIDTTDARANRPFTIDHNVEVTGERMVDGVPVYIAHLKHTELDDLLDAIMPNPLKN